MKAGRRLTTVLWRTVAACALAVAACVFAAPSAYADGNVAWIGGTGYETFDQAVAAASDGDTITLGANATTSGLNLNKNLTVDGSATGKFTLTFEGKGIALWGHALTFKNVSVAMAGIGSTPYTAEWSWMTVCASRGASLSLENATMTLDGTGTSGKHAIYFTGDNKLNLNASQLTIKNYGQDALEWDGGDGGYNLNIENGSTLTCDADRSGLTGTFTATVDASTLNVTNSRGNGSNGSHFIIKSGSKVDFSDNGAHGLSAGNLYVENSTVTANNNGYNGIIFTGKGEFKSAKVSVSGTKGKSYWNAGIRLLKKNATLDVDAATVLSIRDNLVTGLFLDSGAKATIAEGANVSIVNNTAAQEMCSTEKELARCGGGVLVRAGAQLSLPASAAVYNNHAALAGDDIYCEAAGKDAEDGTVSFGQVGENWQLGDCGDVITGWFDDSKDNRWSAHWTEESPRWHVDPVEAGAHTGALAIKAAHGVTPGQMLIAGTKVLNGDGATLAAGDYAFTLSQNGQEIARVSNDDEGHFAFTDSAIEVAADDIIAADGNTLRYTMEVAEVKGDKPGVTYDTSIKKVVVTATPEDDHVKLSAQVDDTDVEDLSSALTFTNTYTAPKAPETTKEDKSTKKPSKAKLARTGDASYMMALVFAGVAVVAIAAGVIVRRHE